MPRRSAPLTIPRLSSLLPQTEKAYQKQVGVNVGYVSTRCVSRRPRSDPKASLSRRKAHARKHRSPRPSLPFRAPADSPLPPRRRRPARLAPATTRTSVSASRLPARLLRVRAVAAVPRARSRPARTHRGRVGLSLCGRAKGFFRRRRGRGTVHPLSSHPADLPLSLSESSLARQARTSTRSAPSPATCPSAGAS